MWVKTLGEHTWKIKRNFYASSEVFHVLIPHSNVLIVLLATHYRQKLANTRKCMDCINELVQFTNINMRGKQRQPTIDTVQYLIAHHCLPLNKDIRTMTFVFSIDILWHWGPLGVVSKSPRGGACPRKIIKSIKKV